MVFLRSSSSGRWQWINCINAATVDVKEEQVYPTGQKLQHREFAASPEIVFKVKVDVVEVEAIIPPMVAPFFSIGRRISTRGSRQCDVGTHIRIETGCVVIRID
jgi:hypothetical protein